MALPLQFSFYLSSKWCFHALKIKVMYLWDSGNNHFALFLSWNNFRLVQTLLTTEFPTESTYSFYSSGILQNHRKSVKTKPWASHVLLTEDSIHTSPWFSTHILSGLLWWLSSRVVAMNWLFFSFLYSMDISSPSPGEGHGVLPCKEGSVFVYYGEFFCTSARKACPLLYLPIQHFALTWTLGD